MFTFRNHQTNRELRGHGSRNKANRVSFNRAFRKEARFHIREQLG